MDEKEKAIITDLYMRYSRELVQYALHKTKDSQKAQDIVQQVFLQAATKPEVLCQHPNKIGWLYITTGYVLKQQNAEGFVRGTKAEKGYYATHVPLESVPERQLVEETEYYEGEAFDGLAGKLSSKEIEYLRYRYGEDMKVKEISVKMGMSNTAVTSFASRLLQKIKKTMGMM